MVAVAAVVVTWNRPALLGRCLDRLASQTRALAAVLVIDNASDAPTRELLQARAAVPPLTVIRLEQNLGGAGGFCRGIAEAFARGYDWIWVMDDDCVPEADALAQLLAAADRFPPPLAPRMLASQVEWTDGTLHPFNVVAVKHRGDKRFLYAAAERGCLSMRSATFVSLLIHREVVERQGLPHAAYFLWMDDVEYSARFLRSGLGVLVPASRVVHHTKDTSTTLAAPPPRFRLHVRNSLWMLLYARSHAFQERLLLLTLLGLRCLSYLRRRWWSPRAWWAVGAGGLRGLLPPPAAPRAALPPAPLPEVLARQPWLPAQLR